MLRRQRLAFAYDVHVPNVIDFTLLRGFEQARGEWSLMCTAHNLLKLATAPA